MAASLSAGASSFTPRAKSAIKISRPDGTAFDIAAAATAAKSSQVNGSATSSAHASETETVASPSSVETPASKVKTGLPYKPVVVRLETEAQKVARLAEEAKERKIKEIEQKEAEERKERKAREEKEKAEKAEKEKKEAEEKVSLFMSACSYQS
jgi:translation initiation factor 4G